MAAEGGVMNHDDLDHLLSHETEIVPSFGFTASVMNAVRAQAQAPPPIPFPWKRALPGMAAAVLSLAWMFLPVSLSSPRKVSERRKL
jgi:hypothetical protein